MGRIDNTHPVRSSIDRLVHHVLIISKFRSHFGSSYLTLGRLISHLRCCATAAPLFNMAMGKREEKKAEQMTDSLSGSLHWALGDAVESDISFMNGLFRSNHSLAFATASLMRRSAIVSVYGPMSKVATGGWVGWGGAFFVCQFACRACGQLR